MVRSRFISVCSALLSLLAAWPVDAAAPEWILPPVSAPRVQHHTFESAAARTQVSCHVYTPAVYDTEPARRFPVLYWLHGTGGGAQGIAPLSAYLDRAMRDGKIPPALVVFPNGMATSMWCDSKDGAVPMETVVVKDLVAHIDTAFRTIARREGRIIEGFSMGGYGAARLGLRHPDIFGAVSILAGGPLDLEFAGPRATADAAEHDRILKEVYGGDMEFFKAQSPWMQAAQNAERVMAQPTAIRIVVGRQDSTGPLNRRLSDRFTALGIKHTFTVLPGVGHSAMPLLDALGGKNWEFYRAAFGSL
ncbi:MAG: hypothetical protein K1X78_26510 [Verrucomicrobiaceae bacterium]|nr:hypothetical protein [Verrucomicrobiaceae bacterium]